MFFIDISLFLHLYFYKYKMKHNIFKLYPGGEIAPPNVLKINTFITYATI